MVVLRHGFLGWKKSLAVLVVPAWSLAGEKAPAARLPPCPVTVNHWHAIQHSQFVITIDSCSCHSTMIFPFIIFFSFVVANFLNLVCWSQRFCLHGPLNNLYSNIFFLDLSEQWSLCISDMFTILSWSSFLNLFGWVSMPFIFVVHSFLFTYCLLLFVTFPIPTCISII